MTTENGLPHAKLMNRHIDTLMQRRVWVQGKIDEREAMSFGEGVLLHFKDEVKALDWAISVCEAERDAALRLREMIPPMPRH